MLIAVISDTHLPRGSRRLPADCVERIAAADLVIHAGDIASEEALAEIEAIGPPVAAVHGNVDPAALRRRLPEARTVEANRARIAVIHDAGPRKGRLERMRARFPDARRGRLRPLPHAAPRGRRRRLPDLQPRQPDRPPPRPHPHNGPRARRRRRGRVRADRPTTAERPGRHRIAVSAGRSCLVGSATRHDPPVMDLDVLFVGTAGSAPTARRGLPATLDPARRRSAAVRLRRGHAAPARALGRAGRARGGVPHPLPRRPRPRPARDAEDVQPPRPRDAADRLRAAGPEAPVLALRPIIGRTTFAADARRARAERASSTATATAIATVRGRPRRTRATATRWSRTRARAASTSERARELGVRRRPRLRPAPARRAGDRRDGVVRPTQVLGEPRPRPQAWSSPATPAPCDMTRARRARRRPARARGHLHRRGRRACGADRPLDRAPGGRDRRRRRGRACSR